MKNEGNTTYLNSVIQCIGNITSIASHYLENLNYFEKHVNDMPISYVFSRIIFHLNSSNENIEEKEYTLSHFKKVLIFVNPIFKGNSTKNAIDFLVYFLNTLHDDDIKMASNNNQQNIQNTSNKDTNKDIKIYLDYLNKYEKSCIFNNFSWINEKQKECWQCKNIFVNYQRYFSFDLNIDLALNNAVMNNKKEISILDCIKCYLDKQTLYNIFCEKCQNKFNFNLKMSIINSPRVFVFLLRINDNNEIIKKIKDNNIKINIEEVINLKGIVQQKDSYEEYKLNSIIFFDLNGKLGYIAYCCNPIDNNWYKYEDNNIIKVELSEILNMKDKNLVPVILFYKKNKH